MNYIARLNIFFLLAALSFLSACEKEDELPRLEITSVRLGSYVLSTTNSELNAAAPVEGPVVLVFSHPLSPTSVDGNIMLRRENTTVDIPVIASITDNNTTVTLELSTVLQPETGYVVIITPNLNGSKGEHLARESIIEFRTAPLTMTVESILMNGVEVKSQPHGMNVDPNDVQIQIRFSHDLNAATVNSSTVVITGATAATTTVDLSEGNVMLVTTQASLKDWSKYVISVTDELKGKNGEIIVPLTKTFYTGDNNTPDYPIISDDALLTLVQQQTFKYFWDFAEPVSGMARERNTSGNLITSGGSGFGLMAIIVGIERNFITRADGLQRLQKILTFLESADRFHGAWSHWIDGTTGKVIPFSANDNGGDLVETAFLVQGLLTFRQYLNPANANEQSFIDRINTLWEGVEWDWYTRGGQQVLYWHWSPDKQWTMNHQIRGHNETLITYLLAASSPSHTIDASVYHEGYARNGGMQNGREYFGLTLPLGEDYGGPLFFSHYSFLGLDPRNLEDSYADYWTQNRNHTLINRAYAISNPKKYVGYNESSWGLTASDNNTGYSAHSPLNDLGIITPTAALSSFPYTPEESMEALKFFYYSLGDRLWGDYGFYDAYNLTAGWVANSYLAIDQGPIIIMIENHRTALLWDLFMSAPEIQNGLDKLDFNF